MRCVTVTFSLIVTIDELLACNRRCSLSRIQQVTAIHVVEICQVAALGTQAQREFPQRLADLMGRIFLKVMPALDRDFALIGQAAAELAHSSRQACAGVAVDEQLW